MRAIEIAKTEICTTTRVWGGGGTRELLLCVHNSLVSSEGETEFKLGAVRDEILIDKPTTSASLSLYCSQLKN